MNSNETPPAHMDESPPLADYERDETVNSEPAALTYGIKVDSRTDQSVLLTFIEVATETPKAICLTCFSYEDSIVKDTWLPKKLCSNMNTIAKTINVWDVFFNEHKAEFLEPADSGE